jgi:hypothetical protein
MTLIRRMSADRVIPTFFLWMRLAQSLHISHVVSHPPFTVPQSERMIRRLFGGVQSHHCRLKPPAE